jgi:hypothetical protein
MDTILARAMALFQDDPTFWSGVLLWLFGFAMYVPALCGRGDSVFSKTGTVLGWLGFAITLFAAFALNDSTRLPSLATPTLDAAYWLRSSTQIWMLWLLGSALVVASGLRWFTARVGWLGLATAMVGVIASWFAGEAARHTAIQFGTAIVSALLILVVWRGDLSPRAIEPGDYEAELIALCGSRRRASRLIDEELQRRPALSRAGAALAVVTRVRHERNPAPSL